jgi:hypothetical protein
MSHVFTPWVVGLMFSMGIMLVDGTDGYLASRTQSQAIAGGRQTLRASRSLGIFVVVFHVMRLSILEKTTEFELVSAMYDDLV